MNTFRYVLAVLVLVSLPPGLLIWFLAHPLARFWRRLGAGWTFGIHWSLMLAVMVGLYLVREPFLRVEFGTSIPLIGLALVTLCAAAALLMKRKKHLTFRVLSGIPEFSRAHYPGVLLTQGIYAKIRHPRYVEVLLGTLSYALVANYLATYALVAVSVPMVYAIVLLEERELRERFGSAYDEYCRRTPRFIPSAR